MKNFHSNETELVGEWKLVDGKMIGNEACSRIDYLVNHVLKKLASDKSGWDIIYQDPADGRLWELTYPRTHMHGGGPPQLRFLPVAQAKAKHGDKV